MGTAMADPSRATNAPANIRRRALRRGGVRTISSLTVVPLGRMEGADSRGGIHRGRYTLQVPCGVRAAVTTHRSTTPRRAVRRGVESVGACRPIRSGGADSGELQAPAVGGHLVVLGPEVVGLPGVDGRLVLGTGLPHG